MRKRQDKEIDIIKVLNEGLDNIKIKYKDFISYLDEDFYISAKDKFQNLQVDDIDVDISLSLSFLLDNFVMKYLCNKAKNGDVDLEIKLIDKYSSITNLIKRKRNIDLNSEDILIYAIENYDGSSSFSSFINESISNILEPKDYIYYSSLVKKDLSRKVLSILEVINKLGISSSDELLNNFINLRFGFIDNYYYSLKEICDILKISYEQVLELYKKSLEIAKDTFMSYYNNEMEITKSK